MSATLKITVTCDGCNRVIAEEESKATREGFVRAKFQVDRVFRDLKHMDHRQAWRATEHYCRECADGVPAICVSSVRICG
jgi:hypothetical protein